MKSRRWLMGSPMLHTSKCRKLPADAPSAIPKFARRRLISVAETWIMYFARHPASSDNQCEISERIKRTGLPPDGEVAGGAAVEGITTMTTMTAATPGRGARETGISMRRGAWSTRSGS